MASRSLLARHPEELEPIRGTDIVALYRPNPAYPQRALERGTSGWVQLEFDVTDSGTVENVRVVQSTDDEFERQSIATIQKWRYVPKFEDGLPVRREDELTVLSFCLEPCRYRTPPPERGPDGRYPTP